MKRTHIMIAVFFACILSPNLLFPILKTTADEGTGENRSLAAFPTLSLETIDTFPSGVEDWINDHAAFRNRFLSLNARLNLSLFQFGDSQDVITGKDGWYFYTLGSSVEDFLGTNRFSAGELQMLAHSRPSTTPGKKKAPNLSSCVLPIKKAYTANSSRTASPHRTDLPAAVNCSIIWKYTQMSQLSIHTRSSKTAGTISGISKPTPTGTMLPDFSSPGRSLTPLAAPPRRSRTSLSPMSRAIRAIWQTCSTCQNPCATIPKQMYPGTETM
jgi:hypothetical protein